MSSLRTAPQGESRAWRAETRNGCLAFLVLVGAVWGLGAVWPKSRPARCSGEGLVDGQFARAVTGWGTRDIARYETQDANGLLRVIDGSNSERYECALTAPGIGAR